MSVEQILRIECDAEDCNKGLTLTLKDKDLQVMIVQVLAMGWAFDPYYLAMNTPLYCPQCKLSEPCVQ